MLQILHVMISHMMFSATSPTPLLHLAMRRAEEPQLPPERIEVRSVALKERQGLGRCVVHDRRTNDVCHLQKSLKKSEDVTF